jgi:hypothetical protein
MLNLRADEDEELAEEELELYSWFGEEDYQSGLGDESNSAEEEEEEDEDDGEGNFTTGTHFERGNHEGLPLGQYKQTNS